MIDVAYENHGTKINVPLENEWWRYLEKNKEMELPASLNINCFVINRTIKSLSMINWKCKVQNKFVLSLAIKFRNNKEY